jgi:hypothetical protein
MAEPLQPLLCDARALVAKHTRREPSAAQLLLDFYAAPYGYRYQSVTEFAETGSRPGRGIDPGCWRGSVGSRRLGKHVVVDWENNTVTEFRTAPDLDASPRPDLIVGALELMREFLPVEPVYQIRLVRLCTRDVFAALRWAGLVPPADAPPTPAATPASPLPTSAQSPARPGRPKPKRVKVASWLPDAIDPIKGHPPKPEWTNAEYARYLKQFAPKDWEETSIANGLSKVRPRASQKKSHKAVSQEVSQK